MSRLVVLLVLSAGLAAVDPYQAWSQGRPAESAAALAADAASAVAWCDAGLAYAAAGEHGPAVAALLRAHRLDPTLDESRLALRSLGCALPPTMIERVGPLAFVVGRDDEDVRLGCLEQLLEARWPWLEGLLIALSYDPSDHVRQFALEGLALLAAPSLAGVVGRLAGDPDVRGQAAGMSAGKPWPRWRLSQRHAEPSAAGDRRGHSNVVAHYACRRP